MMKPTPAMTSGWMLLANVLLSLSVANPVQATGTPNLPGKINFVVTPPNPLCTGATVKIIASYAVFPAKGVQSPPPNATGTLTATSTLNGISGTASAPFPSGDVNINYKASKEGEETIVATLSYPNFNSIKSAPLRFKVQKCDYYFSISAHAVVETDYGDADEIYKGEGFLKVADDGTVSGTIPIHWSFTLKTDESNPIGCVLTPQLEVETSMKVTGTMETVDRVLWVTHILVMNYAYDDLKIPSANVKCIGNKVNIPFSIPTVNPVSILRQTWEARTGTGSRLKTVTDSFGPGEVVFAVSELTSSKY
jgi:hypothetical protein